MSNALTAANLSEQNHMNELSQTSDEPLPISPSGTTVLGLEGEGSGGEEEDTKGLFEKKRKYSAQLFAYTKGMWKVVREDIENKKASGELGSASSQTTSTDSDSK